MLINVMLIKKRCDCIYLMQQQCNDVNGKFQVRLLKKNDSMRNNKKVTL